MNKILSNSLSVISLYLAATQLVSLNYLPVLLILMASVSFLSAYLKEYRLRAELESRKTQRNELAMQTITDSLALQAGVVTPAVRVFRSGSLSAFLLRCGKTYVLALSEPLVDDASPAEIRGIIAHELGHLYHKDSLRRTGLQASTNVLALYIGVAAAVSGGGSLPAFLAGLPVICMVELFGAIFLAHFCQKQEFRADRFGKALTGTKGLASWLERYIGRDGASGGLFSSHPNLVQRVKRLR